MRSHESPPERGFLEEEHRVESHSDVFKKELGLRDLVLTQIVFVVGTSWVGTAAKLGPSQTAYWLFAILLFYLPIAAVIIYLNRIMFSLGLEFSLRKLKEVGATAFIGATLAILVMSSLRPTTKRPSGSTTEAESPIKSQPGGAGSGVQVLATGS